MTKRQEVTKNVNPKYKIIDVRAHASKPLVWILADDENNERVGLFSENGGKTFIEAWRRNTWLTSKT